MIAFFKTPLGRLLIQFVFFALIAWATYSWIFNKGIAKCKADQATAAQKAEKPAAKIAAKATEKAAVVVDKIDKKVEADKVAVHVIYRDRPVTAPIKVGSCVHPLDPRTQKLIEDAAR